MSKRRRHGLSRRELLAIIERQEKRIAELEAQVARLLKNSSTSSKPPSSDIVKPPGAPNKPTTRKRSRGAQPGHPKHERAPFAPEEIDATHAYTLDACPDCGGLLARSKQAPRVIQQVELLEKPYRVEEHRALAYWCGRCVMKHHAALPQTVEHGRLAGPRLTAHIAYLKGACHLSFSTMQRYLRDGLGLQFSRGQLCKLAQKAARALETPYEELLQALPHAPRLNVDETGHKENRVRFWTWCFRAPEYTVFKIAPSRGSQVLRAVLGDTFGGVLGCDYFSAYRKYMKDADVLVQFCLAHLIRDLRFLTTLPNKAARAYGETLLKDMRTLFTTLHRREKMGKNAFAKALYDVRCDILRHALHNVPASSHAQCMARRFEDHGDAYFRFITTPGMEPTNNLAEQAIRFVVIDRRITQGTRGLRGREWSERIWTTLATCATQGRNAYGYITEAIQAHLSGKQVPSLMPMPP